MDSLTLDDMKRVVQVMGDMDAPREPTIVLHREYWDSLSPEDKDKFKAEGNVVLRNELPELA